jgi:hypothetical protein
LGFTYTVEFSPSDRVARPQTHIRWKSAVTSTATVAASARPFAELLGGVLKSVGAEAPVAITANPSLPASNLGDLVALAKREPGKLNYGSVATERLGI